MERPPTMPSAPVPRPTSEDGKMKKKKSRAMPTPQEMVSHYEKQGMETREASLKVIQDLQTALFRMITANRSRKPPDSKLDALHSRLLHLETKLDSKPSYPQALALGVSSAGIWNAAVQIWNFVRRTDNPS